MGVTSDEAFSAGVLPDPTGSGTTAEFPVNGWVLRDRAVVVDDTGSVQWVNHTLRYDLRAQRKIDNAVLFLVMNNQPIRGTVFNVRMIGLVRALCLLP